MRLSSKLLYIRIKPFFCSPFNRLWTVDGEVSAPKFMASNTFTSTPVAQTAAKPFNTRSSIASKAGKVGSVRIAVAKLTNRM
jgi:hypothetical protein